VKFLKIGYKCGLEFPKGIILPLHIYFVTVCRVAVRLDTTGNIEAKPKKTAKSTA
jgi:hypothetical protein